MTYLSTVFPSVAIAFQAARVQDPVLRQRIAQADTYEDFLELVQHVDDPPDWPSTRDLVMEELVRQKFIKNNKLREKLLETG